MGNNQGKIWLIGGTSESGEIAKAIAFHGHFCVVTVTTTKAIALYPVSPYLHIKVGKMDFETMKLFCLQEQITTIIDSSHPFAVEVSRQAIAIATQLNFPYLRYERDLINQQQNNQNSIFISSFENLFNANLIQNKRVLLTIGIRYLPLFKPWQDCCTIFTRILPTLEAITIASESGFTPERIIALRPPITEELETALWQNWQISLVITKASGKAGGEDIKHRVAEKLNIPLIIIERPKINYPQQTSNINDLIKWIGK
jgi:precorrin-6A/cobalt-precorrin-6A reductase